MFDNLSERIEKEMKIIAGEKQKINLIADKDRGYCAWIGGGILSGLDAFDEMWITREEYDEYGSAIVHKKCIGLNVAHE